MTAGSVTGRPSTRKSVRGDSTQGPFYKVLVALRGIDKGPASGSRAEKSAAMRASAKAQRTALLAWLRDHDAAGQFRKAGEVTAFGTLTLECSAEVMRLLNRAPQVESVSRVSDLPLEVVRRKP